MQLEDFENLRSERSREKAYVRFLNFTDRTVEVIWINFTGSYVSYQLLERGRFIDINTYKRHPWIVLDHKTRDRLHIDKDFVYHPKTTREFVRQEYPNQIGLDNLEARIPAKITVPIYSLRYASLLAVRNCLHVEDDVDELELPKELATDLKKVIKQRNNQIIQPLIRIEN